MYKQLHQITKSSHKDSLEDEAVGSLALWTAPAAGHSPLPKLVIFEDRPNFWDAWDVEIHHLEKATQLEFANMLVVAQGPLRASVPAEVEYGDSRISVTVRPGVLRLCRP
jgi:hypothetical protein